MVSENGSSDVFILKLNGETLGITKNQGFYTSLYPNPSTGKFTLELGKEIQNVTVQIINILGQIVSSEEFPSAKNIESEIITDAGIYFVKVSTPNEGSNTIKIIKQ